MLLIFVRPNIKQHRLEPIVNDHFKQIFLHAPGTLLILGVDAPHYTIREVNQAYLDATNTMRDQLVGKSVFHAFPANPTDEESKNIERTIFSFEEAIRTGEPHTMSKYRYDIPVPGTTRFEERYWTTTNTPVRDAAGKVAFLIHSPRNVTETVKLAERERDGLSALKQRRRQLLSTFMQAPVGIAIFKGPRYVIDLINPPLCKLYGKTAEELLGKPVFDVLEEAKGQGFEELLDRVRTTGEPFAGFEMQVPLLRDGKLENVYINFVYEPFREDDGAISGVIGIATDVTRQVTDAKNLEISEERARLAADSIGLGTYDLDLRTGEVVTSPRFAAIFGFPQPVTRDEYTAVFHPDDLPLREAAHVQAMESGDMTYEARLILPDKTVRWVRIDGKVHFDHTRQPLRLIGVAFDTTEQKQAREQMQKLKTLVDNSVDLMSVLEFDGRNSYLNQAGKKLLGFTSDEDVVNTPIASLHTPEDFALVEREVIPSVMQTGKWSGTMMVRNVQTGERFPVINNTMRIDDPLTGTPMAVGAVMRDLRPEIAATQVLRDREEHFRLATTAAQLGTFDMDLKAGTMEWDPRCRELFGIYSDRPVTYEDDFLPGLHEEDRLRIKEITDTVLDSSHSDGNYDVEYRTVSLQDQKVRWVRAKGKAFFDGQGLPVRFIGSVLDITDKKQEEIRKNDFIAMVSHELKTPLTSIKSYVQIVLNKLQKSGDLLAVNMLSRVDSQTNKMVSLINGFLNIARLENGRMKLQKSAFSVQDLVRDCLQEMNELSSSHRIHTVDPADITIHADREKLGQVLINLLSNAIKYSPPGNDVEIGTRQVEGNLEIWVKDKGIGIKAEDRDRLFERFYRVEDHPLQTVSGFGIGLYLVSEILALHQGRIWVESEPGAGSVFTFSIPLS